MNLVSLRIITENPKALVAFYEAVTGIAPAWATEDFAELATPSGTLAIASTRTLALFGQNIARPAANASVIVEFITPDVDADFARLHTRADLAIVQEPTTMPWGNRSLLLRDPDGNLVNLFTPVSPEARQKFAARA